MQEDKPDQQQIIHKVMFSASYKLRRTALSQLTESGHSYRVTSTWFHPFLLQKTNVNTETKVRELSA